MINKILESYKYTDFDFRAFANPDDPLKYLFTEWVNYYKMKYAICKVINPKSILEIGVRYGYSGITFLNACPETVYIGIDNDSSTFGGSKGAINWAKKITKPYKAKFIIEDTSNLKEFPGYFYDFVHIDGQQDGNGTFNDLEKAFFKAKYILVDGYFWSKENLLSASYFMQKYKNLIEYSLIIPDYAGELLIKTKLDNPLNIKTDYLSLKSSYDTYYYLNDCGGYESFKKYAGRKIEDMRIIAASMLATSNKKENVLDIGCGRGELAFLLSQSANKVIAIDYSKDSIKIAKETYKDIQNIDFIEMDFFKFNTKGKFDKILVTDVIEHIDKSKTQEFFSKISQLLSKTGLLIAHTAPNKLSYMYDYKKKYELAKSIGTYIPQNPRTFYEDLMHINEQTPAELNRALKKIFPYVYVWTASLPDIKGDIGTMPNKSVLKKNLNIFAIASKKHIDMNLILSLLEQRPLNPAELDIEIKIGTVPQKMKADTEYELITEIKNNSHVTMKSFPPYPIHIAYHWKNAANKEYVIYDGIRTTFDTTLLPNSTKEIIMKLKTPATSGVYILEVSLVQETQFWFEQYCNNLPQSLYINVED